MEYKAFELESIPNVSTPVMIVGFRGWGNALAVSADMATYIVGSHPSRRIGRIDPDICFRYDENRPLVNIQSGSLKSLESPGGEFYLVQPQVKETPLIVLIADEPSLNWYLFSDELVDLALGLEASAVITIGSMYDHVLHTDRIISAVTTGSEYRNVLKRQEVMPVDYQGPGAIHTLILDACLKKGVSGCSLWCHCPAYLQGISHHGIMIQLARLIADMAGITIDTEDLELQWKALEIQIQDLVQENPKLEGIINAIRRKKRKQAWERTRQGNVISLQKFRDSTT